MRGSIAFLAGGEEVWKVAQYILSAQVQEQFKRLVQHLVGPGIRPVDLVDHHHRLQPALQRL